MTLEDELVRQQYATQLGVPADHIHLCTDPVAPSVSADRLIVMVAQAVDVADPVPGSVVAACERCGRRVWVAPDSVSLILGRRLAGQPVETVCSRCLL